jgi:SM-20-related protein
LQTIFDCLIDSFIDNKVGLADGFLTLPLAAGMKANLLALYAEKQLLSAGIGNDSVQNHDNLIRNDKIYWLDRSHDNAFEISFFTLMDSFVSHLNRTCYTGITGYEFHYTLYEKGSFYKKHLDQFRNDKSRAFSMIMYLNVDWKAKDGGELCVYHTDSLQTIAPQNGKCVFFKSSELPHEVLMTNVPRLSITGWLKTN